MSFTPKTQLQLTDESSNAKQRRRQTPSLDEVPQVAVYCAPLLRLSSSLNNLHTETEDANVPFAPSTWTSSSPCGCTNAKTLRVERW